MDCGGRSVLVVDDDDDIRELVTLLLGDEGYEVRDAANGHEALEILSSWRPGVILLDLMMPLMDGATFLARQQADSALVRIPVIMMSSSKTLTAGAEVFTVADVLMKPFDIDMMLSKVSAQVRGVTA
jgi:CheY-like chemotaxis protein